MKISKSKAANRYFLNEIKPQFEMWGLSRNQNPKLWFGGCDYGYCYDFSDAENKDDIKLLQFSIINSYDTQIRVLASHLFGYVGEMSELPSVSVLEMDTFHLLRKITLFNLFSPIFVIKENRPEEIARVMGDLNKRLPILREYLYGK